jgi:hypothetical protein
MLVAEGCLFLSASVAAFSPLTMSLATGGYHAQDTFDFDGGNRAAGGIGHGAVNADNADAKIAAYSEFADAERKQSAKQGSEIHLPAGPGPLGVFEIQRH